MSGALLPSGAGTFTFVLAQMWDSHGRYGQHIDNIKHIGVSSTPADWVPWLIWDYGLEEVVPYVRDMQRVLSEGPEWQRARGTDRAFEIAFTWLNSEGYIDTPDGRHQWWDYQLGFTKAPDDLEQLKQLVGLSKLSQAAEGELFRIFSQDLDYRPVRLDEHRYDDGLFDGYSGVRLWEGSPLISVGVSRRAVFAQDGAAPVFATELISAFIQEPGLGLCMDEMIFDDHPPQPIIYRSGTIFCSARVLDFETSGWPEWWPESWDEVAKPYLIPTYPDFFSQ
ncbi:phage tail protein [Pseudovibrio sp. Tun.PSC04-5.I4]|uniref:phage tail protein n=1 Tax=Pseudovibrio sp. Tun.PSC04-5.I4 TaxID=1798213 RepID=UPI00088BC71A|nr:phage tail protein [Pseudovibrio sp. Tun.PSC04-5.I4]SDQ99799.1 Phage tail protein (Tail_P2_I) [Pseudovibrio sp. Tun.PSC04-5.I4]